MDKMSKHPEESIWLTCRTCRPERWVCTVCRKRKVLLEFCPVRKSVSMRMKSINKVSHPAQTVEAAVRDVIRGGQKLETSQLPKLKVKRIPEYPGREVLRLEQAKDLPFLDVLVFVEGNKINSYDELVQLAAQDNYKDRDFIEVVVLPSGIVDGG